MNRPEPLSPETVDTLLSAELDGDLEAAARDLGLSASEAIAQLVVTPGVDERRAALRRARDLIAMRPAVEPAVEDQLVAGAMARDDLTAVRERRSRHQRQWRVLVATGSVAAAIAVIVGISSMNTGDGSKSMAASAPTTESANAPTPARDAAGATTSTRPDLGDVPNAQALRAPAQRLLSRTSAPAADGAPQPTGKAVEPGTPEQNDAATDPAAPKSYSAFKGAVPACGAAGAHYSFSTPPALVATGTVSGQRVLILIYEGAGTPYADVIRVADCTLVRHLLLG
jgi:hypothetical protein